MSEYVVVPIEDPGWQLDPEMLETLIEQRWPGSDIRPGAAFEGQGSTMHGRVATAPELLSIYLDSSRTMIGIDPAAEREAAEFVSWLLAYIPNFDTEMRFYAKDFNVYLPLTPLMTAQTLLAFLRDGTDAVAP